MQRNTRKRSASALPATLVVMVGVLLATGCSDDFIPTDPDSEPSYIALLLPAVQAAREAAPSKQTTEGPRFHIEQRLFEDGRAVGTALLVDEEASLELHLAFHEGSMGCTDDSPFVHLLLSWHAVPVGPTPAGDGIWTRGSGALRLAGNGSTAPRHTWTVTILPFMEEEPARAVPEEIRFEAELEVVFLEDPCGAR